MGKRKSKITKIINYLYICYVIINKGDLMTDSIKLSVTLPATPKEIYNAWLDSEKHSAFTGSNATIERKVGGKFSASDGYIYGENLLLHMNKRIYQSWRTTDFPEGSEDSRVEITLTAVEKGTKLSIVQTEIPEGDGKKYRKGWKDHYFAPMKKYFSEEE